MSDNSDSELPLPRDKDSDSDDSDSSSSSSSSVRTNDIPIPDDDPELNHQNGCSSKETLAEIPIPDETDREQDLELADSEIDIPLPPDSSKYSPSQATPEDDLGISSSMESKKPGPTVLGKAQAKKRLLAFSAAKLAATSPTAAFGLKKITPTKASVVQKSNKQEQQLAIETIKQEETKMREILAMNSILHQKLKQVNAITHNVSTTPPVTAVVKPTIIAPSPVPTLPSLMDVNVSSSPLRSVQSDKVVKSPDRSRKSSKHIRATHRSSSHGSRSHSRSSSARSRSPSAERKSTQRGRKSRSRSRDRKDKERDRRDKDKEADKKENRGRKSSRKSRSRSKGRGSGKHRRSHSRSRSKSMERDSEKRKKSRSKSTERESERQRHREKESRRSRKSRSRSRVREKKRDTRKGSPDGERDGGQDRDRARGSEKEKSRSDRSKRDEEREKRAEEEKQLYEHEKELDAVRLARLPVDWADYHEHQYRPGDLRIVKRKLNSEAITCSRSQSGSPSPSRPAQEQGAPLSKGSTFDLNTISINSVNDIKIEYPSFLIQKTKTKPSLEFGCTPLCGKGYYKTREQIFSEEDGGVLDAMKEIINSKPSTKDLTLKTEGREWFAATPQAFCPAGGKQAVLISHLYSDEERDESPAPSMAKSSGKAAKKDKKSMPSPSPQAESDEDDSMDSAPSPLLKRKYEAPPSPPRPKKKSRRSPPSESDEEIPLRKDTIAIERETAKEKSKSKKRDQVHEKKYEEPKEREKRDDKRHDEKDDERKEKKRIEKDKKRFEKEKRREGKEKDRDEEKRSGEKDNKHDEKRKKRGDDEEEVNIEKHSKREDDKDKKSRKHVEKEKEDMPVTVEEKHSKSKHEVPEKTKEKKKKRDKEKKAKKKHKKRQESSSSETSPSPSPSSSSSSEESSEDESDHKSKSKHKKLKKKRKAKGKKEKPKPTSRDKSPDSSNEEKGGRDGGGGSHSKGNGSSRKDSHSKSRRDSRDRSRRERSRERDRRSSNYGRRRTTDNVQGEEAEDEYMLTSPSGNYSDSQIETDMLMQNMNPPNPLSGAELQLLDAEIDSILDSSKQTDLSPDPENTTHELLSVFDDDALLQSVLQDENISAEKLLMNIAGADGDKSEPCSSLITQKPFVSWSDDSEEELNRTSIGTMQEKTASLEPSPRTTPANTVLSESITPAASTSGYETEIKGEVTVPDASEPEREPSKRSSRRSRSESQSRSPDDHHDRDRERDRHHRDYSRRDYYDSRSRLLHAHVYDLRGGRRGSFHDRYNSRDRDHRYGGRYYPSHRSSESSHSHRYRDERDRERYSPDRDRDRRRRRYDDDDDRGRYSGGFEKPKEIKSDSREAGTAKTESPPVPDSTISDSELQSGSNTQLVPATEGPCLEYAVDPSYYYDQAMPGMPLIAGQELHGEVADDGGQGFGSPKRLSLDERLEIEMGLEKSQFLPVPRSEAEAPVSQIPILHMNRLHSQINLMGNVIQVIPIDIPAAPIVIRSTYPVATQFDVYGNPIGGSGQYPPRRVITIKVPIVPFTVPVVDPEAMITKEPKIRRKRSTKHEKQKRKPSKIELERAKRKKGAEAKLQRKSKHRDPEFPDRRRVAKESKPKTEAEADAPPAEKAEAEPEAKESDTVKEERENATEVPSESTPPPESELPVPEAVQTQVEGNATVKQEIVEEESIIKTETEEITATAEAVETNVNADSEPPPLKKIEILPPPDRGILVLLGFRDRNQEERKKVKFADGIDPGCGTSSSGGEELASPPPSFGKDPAIEAEMKKKTKRKKKKKKLHGEQADLFAPPSCPKISYPFCPPGILYQVCPQYAVLYAQAMAEKGLDVVFEPTEEVPYGNKGDAPIPVVQPQNSDPASSFIAQPEVPSAPQPVSLPPGIDFTKPPPSTFGAHSYDFATPMPANYSPYENPPGHARDPAPNFRRTQYSESFHTHVEVGSKIPTIVNHQPIKVLSPRSSKPPNSYGKESPIIGQSIQVVTRTTPNPTYPLHEEHQQYNHTYSESAPPLRISSHLEEVPSTVPEYRSSNVLIPLHEESAPRALPAPAVVTVPSANSSAKNSSKKKLSKNTESNSKSGSGDIGISIPLSKIVSNSSIPSLVQNSSHYSNNSSRQPLPTQISPSHRSSYGGNTFHSNYTSYDFTPYSGQSTNSNLISVKPQPISKTNLFEVSITETQSQKPKTESSLESSADVCAVPTSTTSTPSSISPVKSDTASFSPASTFSA